MLEHTKKRYLDEHPPLPNGRAISRFTSVNVPKQAKIQVLYQYICETYPLVDRLIRALVKPNLLKYGVFRLTKDIYRDFLKKEAISHPEINKWAEYTKRRYERAFYTFLRYTGLMENHPSVLVRKFVLRPEAFAFFLFGLIDNGFSPSEILKSHLWDRYFLTRNDVERMLSECQVRGWIQYRSLASIVELVPKFGSVEEWMNALE